MIDPVAASNRSGLLRRGALFLACRVQLVVAKGLCQAAYGYRLTLGVCLSDEPYYAA